MSILARFQRDLGITENQSSPGTNNNPGQARTHLDATPDATRRIPQRAQSRDPELEGDLTSAAQRRPRSESNESVDDREVKRRREFAEKTCVEIGLPPQALDDFAQLKQSDMMIKLQATIMVLKQDGQTDEARKYIRSEEFKDVLKDRLRCCLLSPNLTAYLTSLAARILAYAKKNLTTFKIPEQAVQDPEMLEEISTLMKDLLTSQRSNMKQKLANNIKQKGHISVLAKALAPGNHFELTLNHWARYAFLRYSMTLFNEKVEEGVLARAAAHERSRNSHLTPGTSTAASGAAGTENGDGGDDSQGNGDGDGDGNGDEAEGEQRATDEAPGQAEKRGREKVWANSEFWEFVDRLLVEARTDAMQKERTVQGRQRYMEEMFTKCLQNDLQTYPPSPSQSGSPPFNKVTIPWLRDINEKLIW